MAIFPRFRPLDVGIATDRFQNMATSFRVDSFSRPIAENEITVLADGSLSVPAVVATEGILRYMQADGSIRRELVTAETLAQPTSLATLGQTTVTREHPDEPVNPDNVKKYSVGNVGDLVEYDTAHGVVVRMILRDRGAIEDVKQRLRLDTSPAYWAEYDETPGVHPVHGPYDRIQVRRTAYNHVALCTDGRGENARLLSVDNFMKDSAGGTAEIMITNDQKDPAMPTPMEQQISDLRAFLSLVGEMKKDADAPAGAALAQAKEALGTMSAEIAALAAQRDELTAKVDEMKAELAAVMAEVKGLGEPPAPAPAAPNTDEDGGEGEEPVMDSAKFLAAFNERKKMLELAQAFKVDAADTLTNPKLKEAIVRARLPEMKFDSKAELNGFYKGLVKMHEAQGQNQTQTQKQSPTAPAGEAWNFNADSAKPNKANEYATHLATANERYLEGLRKNR